MAAFLEKFQHNLRVFSLEEIKSITGDFDKNNLIGQGGFGKAYKGVVDYDSKGKIMAAFKRLDSSCGQGDPEFLKEILMLSHYKHENLITLLGYCDKDPEKILVYEYAAHGSLDGHLSSTTLTWTQRLKICLGAARGLCYLHDPNETHQRVIHRDIKSSNILLDENLNAKISDMGLSKIGIASQQQSFIVTNVAGTCFYIDPEYMETSILTKESDVYSFGVVLFEVLCGSLCFENKNGQYHRLVKRWTKSYKQKKLEEIIFHHLKQDMHLRSLEAFSEIAYGCLQKSRTKRPSMSDVVEKLEIALHFQQGQEFSVLELEEMVKATVSKEELLMLVSKILINKKEQELFLSKGVLVNGGNKWFSINKNGEHFEMISGDYFEFTSTDTMTYNFESRFISHYSPQFSYTGFKTHARARFLSPGITYTVSLVFKIHRPKEKFKYLKYMLAGESKFSTSFIVHNRDDGWMMADQLCHFICNKKYVDLNITFDCAPRVLVEGIEIRSMEMVQHEHVLKEEEGDIHLDTYWEQKLPKYWEKIVKLSKDIGQWTTKKELYSIFCKGLLFDGEDGAMWFSLANNGKICQMLSTRNDAINLQCGWRSLSESRETACDPVGKIHVKCKLIRLSPQSTYGTYLVYKLQENHPRFESPVEVSMYASGKKFVKCDIWLLSPDQSPIIRGNVYQKKRIPQQRKDGWMEVPIWEFQTKNLIFGGYVAMFIDLKISDNISLKGLTMEGIEFRPNEKMS